MRSVPVARTGPLSLGSFTDQHCEHTVELHPRTCACGGGSWLVADASAGLACASAGLVRLKVQQWRSIGVPASLEEYQDRVRWLHSNYAERREFQRFLYRFEAVLNRLPTWRCGGVQSERTVTENLGRGGARVISRLATHQGDTLVFREQRGSFETRAQVCAITMSGGLQKLSLRFLDQALPPQLMDLVARDGEPI